LSNTIHKFPICCQNCFFPNQCRNVSVIPAQHNSRIHLDVQINHAAQSTINPDRVNFSGLKSDKWTHPESLLTHPPTRLCPINPPQRYLGSRRTRPHPHGCIHTMYTYIARSSQYRHGTVNERGIKCTLAPWPSSWHNTTLIPSEGAGIDVIPHASCAQHACFLQKERGVTSYLILRLSDMCAPCRISGE
jgi:hypothetical protein